MKRREFVTVVGGAVVAWSFGASAQQLNQMRTVGVILNYSESDSEGQARFAALRNQVRKLGWVEGSNLRIEVRWAAGKTDRMQAYAKEFVSIPTDVIVANSTPLIAVLKGMTPTIPIVFVQVADPIGSGFVDNYARPNGNITGFTDFETSTAGKWIEVLKEAAPSIHLVTVLIDPEQKNHEAFLRVIKSAAVSFNISISASEVRNRGELETVFTNLAGQTDRGIVVLPGPTNNSLRESIIQLAANYRTPAVYPFKYYATEGGLLYYGTDQMQQWPNAANYVDRIFRGEKPSDLPVQAPIRYELVVNLKTARTIGLSIPSTLLARADEVIE